MKLMDLVPIDRSAVIESLLLKYFAWVSLGEHLCFDIQTNGQSGGRKKIRNRLDLIPIQSVIGFLPDRFHEPRI